MLLPFLGYLGHLQKQGKEINGIRDLSPLGNGYSSFLSDLIEAERKIGWSKTPIVAVGGDALASNWLASAFKPLIDGHIGSDQNDLVVRLDSSLPRWISADKRHRVLCNHMSYFKSHEPSGYCEALRALTDWMSWSQVSNSLLRDDPDRLLDALQN